MTSKRSSQGTPAPSRSEVEAPAASDGPDRAWYADGLRFECTGCGRCCTGGDGYAWVSVAEIRALASRLGLEIDEFGRRYLRRVDGRYALLDTLDGDCVFLRDRACTVYEDRPAQCRAFPWWPANLRSPGAWKRAAKTCEGISDVAPLVVAGVIDDGLRLARTAGLSEGGDEGDDDDEGTEEPAGPR